MDYVNQLLSESRNNVNFHADYTRRMPCPNREKLGKITDWADHTRYYAKADLKIPECSSGEK